MLDRDVLFWMRELDIDSIDFNENRLFKIFIANAIICVGFFIWMNKN